MNWNVVKRSVTKEYLILPNSLKCLINKNKACKNVMTKKSVYYNHNDKKDK